MVELVSPFPSESLPVLFHWLRPYIDRTEHKGKSLEDFMAEELRKHIDCRTWGVTSDGELGAYIELSAGEKRVGVMNLISKKGFFRPEIIPVGLGLALDEAFEEADLILFYHPAKNTALAKMYKRVGAVEIGYLPDRCGNKTERVMGLTKGEWLSVSRFPLPLGSANQKGEAA